MAGVDRLVDYFVVVGMGDRPTPVVSDLSGNITSIFDVDPVEGKGDNPDHQLRLDLASWRKGTDAKGDIVEMGVIFPEVEELPDGWEILENARLTPGMSLPGQKKQPAGALCCRRRGTNEKDLKARAIAEVFVEMPLNGRRRPQGYKPIRDSLVNKLDADLTLNRSLRTYIAYRRQRADEHSLYHDDPALVDVEIHPERDGPSSNEYDTAAVTFQTKNMGPVMAVSYRRQEPIGLCDHRYRAEVLEWFPEEEIDGVPIDRASIPMFAFPSGLNLQRAPLYKTPIATFFPFVLTSGAGVSTYVACMTFYEPKPESLLDEVASELRARDLLPHVRRPSELKSSPSMLSLGDEDLDTTSFSSRQSIDAEISVDMSPSTPGRFGSLDGSPKRSGNENVIFVPKCICVSSRLPFLRSFRQWLGQVYTLSMSSTHIPLERSIAHLMFQVPVPEPSGPPVRVRLFPRLEAIDFSLPPHNGLPKIEIPFSVLFECLDTNNVMLVLLSLMLEKPVVLLSKYSSIPTECGECLLALLFPLRWDTIYIPRLTEATLTVLEYPGAALLGVSDEHDPYGDSMKVSKDSPTLKTSTSLKQKVINLCSDEALLVDLDKNDIWCKSRSETQVVQQLGKDLPGKLVKALKNRWEQTLSYYGIRVGQGPSSSPDAGFDLAPTPDNCDSGGPSPVWCSIADRRIRDAAVVFLASIMEGYKECLIIPDFNWRTSTEKWFDTDLFLRNCDPKLKIFNKRFLDTQLFVNFIQFRTESSDARFVYFDCCVEKLPEYESMEESRAVQNTPLPERPTLQDVVEETKRSLRGHRPRPSWWKGSSRRSGEMGRSGDSAAERRIRRSDSMLALGKKLAAVATNGDRKDDFSSAADTASIRKVGESENKNALVVEAIQVPPPSEEGLPEDATYVYKHNGHLHWPTLDKTLLGGATSTLTLNLRRRRRAANVSRVLVRTEQELSADLADVAYYLSTEEPEPSAATESETKTPTDVAERAKRGGTWGASQRLALQVFGSWFVCLATMVNATSQNRNKPEKKRKKGEPKPRADPKSSAMTEFLLGIGFGVLRQLQKMDLTPDEPTYRAMIIACGRGGPAFSRDVGLLLSDMKRNGITPNAVTYGQYTQSVAQAGANESDATEVDCMQLLNRLLWLDPSLEILDCWGKQWRQQSAPPSANTSRPRSRSGSFNRTGSFNNQASRPVVDSAEIWCPDYFNAFAGTAPVCISTSFELAQNSLDLLRLSTTVKGVGDPDGNAHVEGNGSSAPGTNCERSVPNAFESALKETSPGLQEDSGPVPAPPVRESSQDRATSYASAVALAAIWSAQACRNCGYVPFDEEIMQSWVEHVEKFSETTGTNSDAHKAVQVPCPRCKHLAVPSLFVQVYDVSPDGQLIPWQKMPKPASVSDGSSEVDRGALREGQQLRRGSLVMQAAERAHNPHVNLGADLLDLDPTNLSSQTEGDMDAEIEPMISSPAPHLASKRGGSNTAQAASSGCEPMLGSIGDDSPTLHDDDQESAGTIRVPYLAPHIVRHAIEHLILTRGESALHRDTLRQEEPELYWNLQWYCCRFRLPLPLFYNAIVEDAFEEQRNKVGSPAASEASCKAESNECGIAKSAGNASQDTTARSWIACAAWDKAAAIAAVTTVCRNVYQSCEWHRFWNSLTPETVVQRNAELLLEDKPDLIEQATAAGESLEAEGKQDTSEEDMRSADFVPVPLPVPEIPSEVAKRALERFYAKHNPDKLGVVPKILKKYQKTKETIATPNALMFGELIDKYGNVPATTFAAEHAVMAAVTSTQVHERVREEKKRKKAAAAGARVALDGQSQDDGSSETVPSNAGASASGPKRGPAPGEARNGAPSEASSVAKDAQNDLQVVLKAFHVSEVLSAVEPSFSYPLTMMDGFDTLMQQSFFLSCTRAGFKDAYRMLGRGDLAVNAAIKYYIKQRSMDRPGYKGPMYRSFLKIVAWSGGNQKIHLVRDRRLGNNFDRPRFEEIFEEKRCFLGTEERELFRTEDDLPPRRAALNCRSMFGHLF